MYVKCSPDYRRMTVGQVRGCETIFATLTDNTVRVCMITTGLHVLVSVQLDNPWSVLWVPTPPSELDDFTPHIPDKDTSTHAPILPDSEKSLSALVADADSRSAIKEQDTDTGSAEAATSAESSEEPAVFNADSSNTCTEGGGVLLVACEWTVQEMSQVVRVFELSARHDALLPTGVALEHSAGLNIEGWCLRGAEGVVLFDANNVELVDTLIF